jgi:uncharacterized protein (TIGR00369 family)
MHSAKPSKRPVMTAEEVTAFLARDFPQLDKSVVIEAVGPLSSRLRSKFDEGQLRPGGTISGPTIMALTDVALYVAVLANIGPVGLAVTTNLSFNFMRRPKPRDLIGDCRLLKLGRTLAVGEVAIRSDGESELVAHATGTYSIPSKK